MKLLSIETSSTVCSISILENTTILYEKHSQDILTHSEQLLPMIKQAFLQMPFSLKDIDLYSCSVGPGSFTGIRIGIATIKGFVDVYQKPAIGISSLEGLCFPLKQKGMICSMIDAKNSNLYTGIWENQTLKEPFSFHTIDSFLLHLSKEAEKEITFVGDASLLYQETIQNIFPNCHFVKPEQNQVSSVGIGLAAYHKYQKKQEKQYPLCPLYLRKSQAERTLEGKQ